MKHIISTIFFTLLFVIKSNSQNQTYHYLAPIGTQGVPTNVTYETVPQTLIDNINASFPEGYPVPVYNPQYIADGIATDIHLQDSADIWVTFVKEGAGYKNVLGFYTYVGSPMVSAPSDVTIIFPNVSAEGSGGGLNTGAKVHLGSFPTGTKIGWILLANAYNSNTNNVGNGLWKLYSNPDYNPEPLATQRKHNVMLLDEASGVIALGFEDIRRDNASCDQDFNDAIFYVKSNPITAINTSNVNKTVDAGSSSSGSEGGLESRLAGQVAQRLFKRQLNDELQLNTFEKQFPFDAMNVDRADELSKFIPQTVFENSNIRVSTPKDLTEMTNASQVLSVDYYENTHNQRLAAILAIETFGKVYEHTKVVCDRLVGAQLTEIRKIVIDDKAFNINKLIQPNKNTEYCLSFSAYNEAGAWIIETQWGVNQFPEKSRYLNFQIWGNSPAYVQRLAIEVIGKLKSQYTNVRMSSTSLIVPGVYAKNGRYKNDVLTLELVNLNNSSSVTITGEAQKTETETTKQTWSYTFTLNGNKTQTVEIPLGKVFDTGIVINNNKKEGQDFMYLADGVWSYGINPEDGEMTSFEVKTSNSTSNDNEYRVERNIIAKGKVKKYAAIFRTLRPSGKTADLSNFDELVFEGLGNGNFEIVLVKKGIEKWEHQFRTSIQLTNKEQKIKIPFSKLRSAAATKFEANDILSVVIAAKGDNVTNKFFDFEIKDLRFNKTSEKTISAIKAFPNPANDILNLDFKLPKDGEYQIEIYDANARLLKSFVQYGQEGTTQTVLNISDLENGIYYSRVKQSNQAQGFKFLVIKNL